MKELKNTPQLANPEVKKDKLDHPLPNSRKEADVLVHWADIHFELDKLESISLLVSAECYRESLDLGCRLLQGIVPDFHPERPRPCRIVKIPCVSGDVHVLLVNDRQEAVHFSLHGAEALVTELKAMGLEVM